VLLLFQEVPGWQGCQNYGAQVLTHPLLVEAAEELFVPIAIYNNTEGDADEKVLKRYKEPAWNYQVVRVVDETGKDLIPRVAKDWTRAAVTRAMVAGLKAAKKPVPKWLQLYADESLAEKRGTQRAIFGMTWFWVGEAEFGLIDGVVKTRQAWIGNKEVVEVWYDPKVVTAKKLESFAKAKEFWAEQIVPLRMDKEQKYYLLQTPMKDLALSEAQACRVNASLDGDWKQYLSPSQILTADRLYKLSEKTSHK
jgi:hypothetical protein